MPRLTVILFLIAGTSIAALAGPSVPEIDPASGANALALVAAGLLILRARRPKS